MKWIGPAVATVAVGSLILVLSFKGRPVDPTPPPRTTDHPKLGAFGDLSAPIGTPRIIVHKAARRIELYDGNALLARWPVGLGSNPVGHKRAEGDGRTPEGRYYVCVKNRQSRFDRSLGLSYPRPADARPALDAGRITRAQHDAIVAAHERGTTPPWKTALGGEVFIHGSGGRSDWTAGCVALDTDTMRTLFEVIPVGTPVEILP